MTDSSKQLQLSPNPDQSPNFLLNNKPLHSRQNPKQEALRFAESLQLKPGELVVLIGVGAGYARVLGSIHEPSSIIYFEPVVELAEFLITSGFVRDVESQGSRFYSRQDELLAGISGKSGIRIVSSPRHRDLFPEAHQALLGAIRTLDQATTGRFFSRWSYCFFRNLGSSTSGKIPFLASALTKPDQRGDTAQSGSFRDGPGVLFCGASPTLLTDLKGLDLSSYFIMAADTALAPLLDLGIEPNLVISIDSGYGTLYHLRAAARIGNLQKLTALAPLTAHPALGEFFGDVIRYRSTFPLDQILAHGPLASTSEFMNSTRNTVGIAILAARAIEAASFRMAGVSFLAARGDSHTRGTGYLLYALERNSRTFPVESYRVGGYGESLTNRNMHTKAALDAMLDSWSNGADAGVVGRNPANVGQVQKLASSRQNVSSSELADYLAKSWDQIRWEQISHLAGANIARWKRRLANQISTSVE